jgi:hypothetical protein
MNFSDRSSGRIGLWHVQLVQEPDSFSQSCIRAFKFTDPALELFDFGLVVSDLLGARSLKRGPLAIRAGHVPMLSWNQIPVEVTLLNHLPPPPERPLSHGLRGKPFLPRPVRLDVILMHQFPNLITADTSWTNSHGCSCSLRLTDSQPA